MCEYPYTFFSFPFQGRNVKCKAQVQSARLTLPWSPGPVLSCLLRGLPLTMTFFSLFNFSSTSPKKIKLQSIQIYHQVCNLWKIFLTFYYGKFYVYTEVERIESWAPFTEHTTSTITNSWPILFHLYFYLLPPVRLSWNNSQILYYL